MGRTAILRRLFRARQPSILDTRRAPSAKATILALKFKLRHYPGFWWSWAGTGHSLTAPLADPYNATSNASYSLAGVVERAGSPRYQRNSTDSRGLTALPGTRAVVAANAVRFQLHGLADNLANVRRNLALPEKVERGSLTLLRATVVKIGAK